MPNGRRVMSEFLLHEISFVDRPAQRGATVTIAKASDPAEASVDELLAEHVPLIDALLQVHDAAPNAEKRGWLLLARSAEDASLAQQAGEEPDLTPFAGALRDAARRRLETAEPDEAALLKAMADLADEIITRQGGSAVDDENTLGKAHYDQFGHVRDPAAALAALREAMTVPAPLAKANAAHDELEHRARKTAEAEGLSHPDAYAAACDRDPELAKRAVEAG